jgi:hypothetical protein
LDEAMPTLAQVKEQIKALPHTYIFYTKREVKHLPKIMTDDERIMALTSGYHGKKTMLLVCTNRRLLFIDKGMFFGLKVKQLNLDRVQSIDSSYVILFGNIQVWDGAAAYNISLVLKDSIDPFVRAVRDAIQQYKAISMQDAMAGQRPAQRPLPPPNPAHYQAPKPSKEIDMLEQLERLAKLKADGHLSEEEFEAQKRKLLHS